MANLRAPRLCTLGLGLATAFLCLPASLAFGPDKPLYVHTSPCVVHGRERNPPSTSSIIRPRKFQWGALAKTSTNATAGATSIPSPSPPPFHARAPRQSCSKNSINGVVTCDLSSVSCCASSGYDVCPECSAPDEVEGEDTYDVANKCLEQPPGQFGILEFTGGTSLTIKRFKSEGCTGDPYAQQTLTFGKCYGHRTPSGEMLGGATFDVTKDVQIGTAAFIEIFESMDACEGLVADPVQIVQEERGCKKQAGVSTYASSFCQGGVVKVYECDDSRCTKNCEPYVADTTINKCYLYRSVVPAENQQDFPSTYAIKTQDPTCD